MPEGPSIYLLKEAVAKFEGKKIIAVSGNTKVDTTQMLNKKVIAFKSWGKHFLICFDEFTVRIHLLMFGSYRIDERKETPARLSLTFKNGELNFYTCSVKIIECDIDAAYDFTADVMNDMWDPKAAKKKLMLIPKTLICDALLEQQIFSGVGNIIKNEVLYRVKIHPNSEIGKIPTLKVNKLIKEARNYSFDFLAWNRDFVLKKHWLAHTKKLCLRCNHSIIKEYTGKHHRRSFICTNCQILYTYAMKIYTGCSGFYNRQWKGVFYPEALAQSKWFAFYCEHFSTIELNSTFYKFPTAKTLDGWYKKSPPGFIFAIKAPRLITHYKKLKDCSVQIDEFYNACEFGLKDKLGCLLFQFPPSFKYDEDSIQLIIKSLKPHFKNVVEFRNPGWWNKEVYDELKANEIIFCSVNHPQMPEDLIITTSTAYVRLHGNTQLFYSAYSDEFLSTLHRTLVKNTGIKEAYIYFNNTASTAGILNAQQFKGFL